MTEPSQDPHDSPETPTGAPTPKRAGRVREIRRLAVGELTYETLREVEDQLRREGRWIYADAILDVIQAYENSAPVQGF